MKKKINYPGLEYSSVTDDIFTFLSSFFKAIYQIGIGITIIIFLIFFSGPEAYCQYLPNPSLEGIPQPHIPPPGWEICNVATSTPDTQPGNFEVFLPASHGNTYIGMTTREYFEWEDVHSNLNTPLSMDSCYIFKIDLAYQEVVNFLNMQPVILKVYGYNLECNKNHLLWTSPAISNTEWQTYECLIHPDVVDITDLVMEVYFTNLPAYWGYMLIDNIRITPTPKTDLGNDTTLYLCEVDSLLLDPGGGFAGYLWQDGSDGQTFSVDTTGLYWVQVFNDEGCSWTDSIFVTIEEYMQMEPEMFDSLIVCEGMEMVIGVEMNYGVQPYFYEWEGLTDTTASLTVTADSTRYYTVTITDNCGNSVTDSLKLVVKPYPDINLGNDTLICSDGEYTLHAGGGFYQYTWQDGSNDSLLTISEPGTYWVTVTSFFGCNATDSITISLFPALPLDLGSDTTYCEGQNVTLAAGEEYVTYFWQDNSTGPEYIASITGIYWLTVTDDKGCTATDSISLTFLPLPQIELGNDTAFCAGEQFILDAGDGFVSYLWQTGDTSQYFMVTQTGNYSVTVNNGCGEASDMIHVEVYPAPVPDLGNDTTLCPGQVLTLEPVGQFVNFTWQDNSTLPFYIVTTSGNYSLEVENTYGCVGSAEIYVSYSDSQVNLGPDSHVCEGDSLVLDAGDGFVSYLWQDNSSSQFLIVESEGTYSITAIDQYGCTVSDAIDIVQYPYPTASLGDDKEICTGDTVVLNAPDGDYTYYWNGQPGDQHYTVSASGTYTLTVANLCDSVSDQIQVTEVPLPEVYLGDDEMIFPGQTIKLDAGEGHDSYIWQDSDSISGQFFYVSESNIEEGPYYYVDVWEGICKSSDTIKIELFQVWVPKVITPNGDSKNDLFQADPERWQGINKHRMIVFNRWGEQVWDSEDFPSGWDGKQNGNYVAEGTYFWILDVYYGSEDIKQTLKGSLSVLGSNN